MKTLDRLSSLEQAVSPGLPQITGWLDESADSEHPGMVEVAGELITIAEWEAIPNGLLITIVDDPLQAEVGE